MMDEFLSIYFTPFVWCFEPGTGDSAASVFQMLLLQIETQYLV